MGIDQPGHYGTAAGIDDNRVVRNDGIVFLPYLGDPPVLEDHDGMVDRFGLIAVEQHSPDDRDWHVGPQAFLACDGRACKDDDE